MFSLATDNQWKMTCMVCMLSKEKERKKINNLPVSDCTNLFHMVK